MSIAPLPCSNRLFSYTATPWESTAGIALLPIPLFTGTNNRFDLRQLLQYKKEEACHVAAIPD